MDIVMIPFTGEASGPYFSGSVVGTGIDTQKISREHAARLSARYMLEGRDTQGNACRIFIENQGSFAEGFVPMLVTDSPLLRPWETAALTATVEGIPGGVIVKIFGRKDSDPVFQDIR